MDGIDGLAATFKPKHLAILLAGMSSPAMLLLFVARFGVDVPWLDQWDLVPFLDGTSHDWWAQHNEHRLLFPRLIMVGLARLTRWDVRWEMWLIVVLAALLFFVLARFFDGSSSYTVPWVIPLLSLIVFSLNQWENWTWGWQIQIEGNALCVAVGIWLLSRKPSDPGHLLAAFAMGVLATFSFLNGLLFWPIGYLILVISKSGRRWRIAWATLSVLVIASFFRGYHANLAHHPSTSLVLRQPLQACAYVLVYLGAPLSISTRSGLYWAACCGAVGVVLFLGLIRRLICRGASPRRASGALGLAAYALGSAAMTSVGRLGFGITQARTPRYIAFSLLLWVAILSLLSLAAVSRWALRGILLFIAASAVASDLHGGLVGAERSREQQWARAALVQGNVAAFGSSYPPLEVLRARADTLRRLRLSVFR
jgi:hypothetical protein